MKKLSIKNTTLQFLVFVNEKTQDSIEIVFQNGDLWASQKMIAQLFGVQVPAISKHITNIFEEWELDEIATVSKMEIIINRGFRWEVLEEIAFYNLDMIISIGYRVNSDQAVDFRKRATSVLKEFAKKGYVIDRKRMENWKFFDEDYFEHLLAEIREIRLSERRLYQKVTDIYATASDYQADSPTTKKFFATVMNKLHRAIHWHTASELIYERVNAEKSSMGLTTRENAPDGKIVKKDVIVAKNYLTQDELESLWRIVSAYLDLAEDRAKRGIPMSMHDWISRLDRFLQADEREILENAGSITQEIAKEKAETEFEKYRITQDKLFQSDFDKFLEEQENLENK